jgi:thymidylate kinase
LLIILEGVDGAGKTTFANGLLDELKDHRATELLHRGPITTHPLIEYELSLDAYRPMNGKHIICDRWHWGELIYGPLYRGESKVQQPDMRHIELFLMSRGALVVLMCASRTEIHRRLDKRGETFLQHDDRNTVIERYYELNHSSQATSALMTAYDGMESEMLMSITCAAADIEMAAAPLNVHKTYVGPPAPVYLILGERRGPGQSTLEQSTPHSSAFVPYPSTSGRFLLEHMPNDVYASCGIANALEEDVYALWETLQRPKIITLGKLAHEHLLKINIPHGAAPHPQFVRRFHSKAGTEYGRVLREAVLHQIDLTGWRP